MSRWFVCGLGAVLTLWFTGCARQETPVVQEPAEEKAAPIEEVIVVEEIKPAEPEVETTTPDEAEAELPTTPRPSLMLGLMLEPVSIAIESTMSSMMALAQPLAAGQIPGLPGAPQAAAESDKSKSESSKSESKTSEAPTSETPASEEPTETPPEPETP